MLAGLGCVVKILFLLNRGSGRARDRGYTCEPLDTSVSVNGLVVCKDVYSIGQDSGPCNIPKHH